MQGALDQAVEFLDKMKEQRVSPDVVSFTTLINGYGKKGDWEKVLEVYSLMRTKFSIEPDEIAYCSLISVLIGCQQPDKALDIFFYIILF